MNDSVEKQLQFAAVQYNVEFEDVSKRFYEHLESVLDSGCPSTTPEESEEEAVYLMITELMQEMHY